MMMMTLLMSMLRKEIAGSRTTLIACFMQQGERPPMLALPLPLPLPLPQSLPLLLPANSFVRFTKLQLPDCISYVPSRSVCAATMLLLLLLQRAAFYAHK